MAATCYYMPEGDAAMMDFLLVIATTVVFIYAVATETGE